MYFLILGLVLAALKYLEYGPMASVAWWVVLIPFALAVAWWAFADASGYTRKKVMEREDLRKAERRKRQRESLGLSGVAKESAAKLSADRERRKR